MRTMIELNCDFCNSDFKRELRFHKRNIKRGIRTKFCGRGCASRHRQHQNPSKNITPGSITDCYSPFRKSYSSAKSRSKYKNLEFAITLQDLLSQWDSQNGQCALSGINLLIPKNTGESLKDPFMASLDRIDSNRGYTPDNIQWLCLVGQFAKNSFTESTVVRFCEGVSSLQKG